MRKETLALEANSTHARDEIVKEFNECIAFARASKFILTLPYTLDDILRSDWSRLRASTSLA
jgi:hypothetical protein